MNTQDVIKRGQEQAVASWINYLNQLRLDALTKALADEKINWQNAAETLDQALETIKKDIVNNGKGRGGKCGMHGFIAEIAECGIGNARKQVEEKYPIIVGSMITVRQIFFEVQQRSNRNSSIQAIICLWRR